MFTGGSVDRRATTNCVKASLRLEACVPVVVVVGRHVARRHGCIKRMLDDLDPCWEPKVQYFRETTTIKGFDVIKMQSGVTF